MKLSSILALTAIFGTTALPVLATAQSRSHSDHQGSSRDDNRRNSDSRHKDRWDKNRGDHRNDRRDNSRYDRYDNNRYDRNDSRYDGRYNDRYDGRYDDRNDSRYNDRDRDRDYDRYNDRRDDSDRRQDSKNEWRNIAIGAGAISVLGLLRGDNTLTFGGAAGALYSLHRYEQDRKSQNRLDRARYSFFSRDYFTRDGDRFDRRFVTKNGERYYQFVRSRR